MNKGGIITLKEKRGGTEHKFSLDHALNLLRLQKRQGNNGWEISDENYTFKGNEICKKSSNRANKETEKRKRSK